MMKFGYLHILTKKGVSMESLWSVQSGNVKKKDDIKEVIRKETHWDVIVVGGGMAGILSAYLLKEQGKRVLVVEAGKVASGQTERTTAKITSQHGLKYSKLIKNIGRRKTKLYYEANEEAINEYERIIEENHIKCGFERVKSYLYSCEGEDALCKEAEALAQLGVETCYDNERELPFEVKAVLGFKRQAQFEPLEFLKGIVSEIPILENTLVTEIKGNWVISKYGILTADHIIVATHYPMKNVPGFYFLRQHQERSYAIALKGAIPIKHMYYGVDCDGVSLRQAGEYLILGGGSHRTGKKKKDLIGEYEKLQGFARQYFPQAEVAAKWAAQDCMPHDGIPFIGKYSVFAPNLYVATGFQKWGMTTSMVAAMLLCDEICGNENPYSELFKPQRLHFRAGIGNFLKDVEVSAKGLLFGMFGKRKCSHMGCELVWNEEEQSWDCPCHGSRFREDGRLLDNPAQKDLKAKR